MLSIQTSPGATAPSVKTTRITLARISLSIMPKKTAIMQNKKHDRGEIKDEEDLQASFPQELLEPAQHVFLMVRIFFDIYREFPPKKMGNFCFDSPLLAIEQGELERDFDQAKPAKIITSLFCFTAKLEFKPPLLTAHANRYKKAKTIRKQVKMTILCIS